jgi:predicted SnoaL-like aldol condensation-catalyzing enzyme
MLQGKGGSTVRLFRWTVWFFLLATAAAFAQSAPQLEANKKLAQKFFQVFANPAQLSEIIHPEYIQHNPEVKAWDEEHHVSGREGLLKFIKSVGFPPPGADNAKDAPPPVREIAFTIAEGDIVVLAWKTIEKDKNGVPYEAFNFDAWRIKDGKLYEHWDAERK